MFHHSIYRSHRQSISSRSTWAPPPLEHRNRSSSSSECRDEGGRGTTGGSRVQHSRSMPTAATSTEDDVVDEVKVFKSDDADREHASFTLKQDKTELTHEADIEDPTQTPCTSKAHELSGAKTAFSKPTPTHATPVHHDPSFVGVSPFAGGFGGFSPSAAPLFPLPYPYHHAPALFGQHYSQFGFNPAILTPPRAGANTAVPSTPTTPLGALSLEHAIKSAGHSPSFGSPFYGAAAAMAAVHAGMSPSFHPELYNMHAQLAAAAQQQHQHHPRFSPMISVSTAAANGPASPAQLSPIHSPASGTPIGSTQQLKSAKDPSDALMALRQHQHAMQQAAAAAVSLAPSLQLPFSPLASMARVPMPPITMTPTHLANSLAASTAGSQSAPGGHHKSRKQLHMNGMGYHRNENALESPRSEQKVRHPKRDRSDVDHIKKPLNAFMIFMKENRQKLMEEKGYKERQSAELNKELGRLWHTLSHEEQQKYYHIAREERQKHQQKYPGWSARDNYAVHKKKKRKRDKSNDNLEAKKCRARFGLERMAEWCKHCKRKKRCLWFREGPLHAPGSNRTASSEEQSPPAQVSSTTHGSPDAVGSSLSNEDGHTPTVNANMFHGLNKDHMGQHQRQLQLNMSMLNAYNNMNAHLFNGLQHAASGHPSYQTLLGSAHQPLAAVNGNLLHRPPMLGSADSGTASAGSSVKLESDAASASSAQQVTTTTSLANGSTPQKAHLMSSLAAARSVPPMSGATANGMDSDSDESEADLDDDLMGLDGLSDEDEDGVKDLSTNGGQGSKGQGQVATQGQRTPPPTRTAFDLATVAGV